MFACSRSCVAVVALGCLLLASSALADPCLTVYPYDSSTFFFDPSTHELVGDGHPAFDAALAIGGEVLVNRALQTIEYSVYQAPGLTGFAPSPDGEVGFTVSGRSFRLAIDGFSNRPKTLPNVTLVVEAQSECPAVVTVNGELMTTALRRLGDLSVQTPAKGNNYSDVMMVDVSVQACGRVTFWAFADADGDGKRDGGECFSAFGRDFTVATDAASWSAVKARY